MSRSLAKITLSVVILATYVGMVTGCQGQWSEPWKSCVYHDVIFDATQLRNDTLSLTIQYMKIPVKIDLKVLEIYIVELRYLHATENVNLTLSLECSRCTLRRLELENNGLDNVTLGHTFPSLTEVKVVEENQESRLIIEDSINIPLRTLEQQGQLTEMPSSQLEKLRGTLKDIYMPNNKITEIDHSLLVKLSRLKKLILSRNRIETWPSVQSLNELQVSVIEFRLDENQFTVINGSYLALFPDLEILYLNKNRITEIDHVLFLSLSSLVFVQLTFNQISIWPMVFAPDEYQTISVTELFLQNNLFTVMNLTYLSLFPKLTGILLANNPLTDFEGFLTAMNTKVINILNTQLTQQGTNFYGAVFWNVTSVTTLYFHPKFTALPTYDEMLKVPKLAYLYFSGNNITTVDLRIFGATPEILEINLSSNRVQVIYLPQRGHMFHKLQLLNLRGNQLKTLPDFCDHLACGVTIHVENNPLACDRNFILWEDCEFLENRDELKCSTSTSESVSISDHGGVKFSYYNNRQKQQKCSQTPMIVSQSVMNQGTNSHCAQLSLLAGSASFTYDHVTGTCTVYKNKNGEFVKQ